MKNTIRKWLEIDNTSKDEKKANDITEYEIRRMVGAAVRDALDGISDYDVRWGIPMIRIKNSLESCISRCVSEPAANTAESVVRDMIYCEKFIDDVIDRINRKQIKEKQQ